jgi:hypothetical protein
MVHVAACDRGLIIFSQFITLEEQINGEAFKDLSKEDLKDMGFKMGPCKIIMKIIEDLK